MAAGSEGRASEEPCKATASQGDESDTTSTQGSVSSAASGSRSARLGLAGLWHTQRGLDSAKLQDLTSECSRGPLLSHDSALITINPDSGYERTVPGLDGTIADLTHRAAVEALLSRPDLSQILGQLAPASRTGAPTMQPGHRRRKISKKERPGGSLDGIVQRLTEEQVSVTTVPELSAEDQESK